MLGYSNIRDIVLRYCKIEGVVFHDTRVSTGKRAEEETSLAKISDLNKSKK